MQFKRIIVTGSISYDYIMSMPTSFKDHIMPDKIHTLNVSFIMKTFRKEFGGTAGNISYTLSLLRTPSLLVGTVGNDFSPYAKHLKIFPEIDLSGIKTYKNVSTACGFVMTDSSDNQIWGFFEGAMTKSKNLKLTKYFNEGDFLVIAPNDPIAMINYALEAKKANIPYLFDPAFNIPHIPRSEMLSAIKECAILIGNDYEIELIKRKLGISPSELSDLADILVITLGAKGSKIISKKKTILIPPAKPANTSDPTGAGDCYRAGFVSGYIRGLPLEICGKMGATSAVYTVEKYGTQTHKFSPSEYTQRFRRNFNIDLPHV